MKSHRIPLFDIVTSTLMILTACGGGGGSTDTAVTSFTSKFNAGLSALATSSGLTSMAVADVFDAKHLDMGFAKADLLAALAANSQALGTNPDLSLFPMAQVSNATLTSCDGNDICTLNATLVNSDVDTTSIDFSTKVKVVLGVVYLYGDQSSTASI